MQQFLDAHVQEAVPPYEGAGQYAVRPGTESRPRSPCPVATVADSALVWGRQLQAENYNLREKLAFLERPLTGGVEEAFQAAEAERRKSVVFAYRSAMVPPPAPPSALAVRRARQLLHERYPDAAADAKNTATALARACARAEAGMFASKELSNVFPERHPAEVRSERGDRPMVAALRRCAEVERVRRLRDALQAENCGLREAILTSCHEADRLRAEARHRQVTIDEQEPDESHGEGALRSVSLNIQRRRQEGQMLRNILRATERRAQAVASLRRALRSIDPMSVLRDAMQRWAHVCAGRLEKKEQAVVADVLDSSGSSPSRRSNPVQRSDGGRRSGGGHTASHPKTRWSGVQRRVGSRGTTETGRQAASHPKSRDARRDRINTQSSRGFRHAAPRPGAATSVTGSGGSDGDAAGEGSQEGDAFMAVVNVAQGLWTMLGGEEDSDDGTGSWYNVWGESDTEEKHQIRMNELAELDKERASDQIQQVLRERAVRKENTRQQLDVGGTARDRLQKRHRRNAAKAAAVAMEPTVQAGAPVTARQETTAPPREMQGTAPYSSAGSWLDQDCAVAEGSAGEASQEAESLDEDEMW